VTIIVCLVTFVYLILTNLKTLVTAHIIEN